MFNAKLSLVALMSSILLFGTTYANAASSGNLVLKATNTNLGYLALGIFVLSYVFVVFEEFIHLRKSKPVILASGIIWLIVAIIGIQKNLPELAHSAVKHNILEYAELFLFLLVAMTYVNAMEERKVFEVMRCWLVNKAFSYRKLFWVTGVLSFFISPIADNLTTALLMCAVVMAVGKGNIKFVSLSCINIVVAANAGGAFSPFGDITTLMVWQKGLLKFAEFFAIFIPSLISYVIPAAIMSFAIPNTLPPRIEENCELAKGAKTIGSLFLITITLAICFHNFLHLPPVVGMMAGLGLLKFFGYYLKMHNKKQLSSAEDLTELVPFDIIKKVERAEWDTLLFFYGVILCVGGLATIGYLGTVSSLMYDSMGAGYSAIHKATPANILVGFLSAIIDNIPVMYAVLTMLPDMSHGQWLLVTLTAGIGGSMLSVGSAAGVALMGQSKGIYTFFAHLKWSWAIAIGYFAAIATHIWLNADLFKVAI